MRVPYPLNTMYALLLRPVITIDGKCHAGVRLVENCIRIGIGRIGKKQFLKFVGRRLLLIRIT